MNCKPFVFINCKCGDLVLCKFGEHEDGDLLNHKNCKLINKWTIKFCRKCIQMTNHDDDGCCKCRSKQVKEK